MPTLYVATDAGLATVSRHDGGAGHSDGWHATWPLAGKQAHCVAVDARRPEHVYCGTFDAGLWRSHDAGRTWRPHNDGLTYPYLWAVAVDARDPATVVVSGSPSAAHAHRRAHAEAAHFRKHGAGRWEQVSHGLPPAGGTMTYALAAAGDGLYAAPHEGDLDRSTDGGRAWEPLHVDWRHSNDPHRLPYVHAIAAAG